MTWRELLDSRALHRHRTDLEEIRALRAVVARDLRDAELAGLSSDRRFAIAYNAVFLLARMVLACAGYRAAFGSHHRATFDALPLAMGRSMRRRARYFQVCRRKRNIVDYDLASQATDGEAEELLAAAHELRDDVERWIADRHPGLAARR